MRQNSQTMGFVIGLILTCMFAVCVFLALAAGAGIYKNISAVMDGQFGAQTAVSYAATKLRHYDAAGCVSLGKLEDTDALILSEEIDGEEYLTYLYCWDGYLRELYCAADAGLLPGDGQQIIAAEEFRFRQEGEMLYLSAAAGGHSAAQGIYLPCGEAGDAP